MENAKTFEITADLRQSPEYANYMKGIGWSIRRINSINIFLKNIWGIKIAKIQRTKEISNWQDIFKILKKEKVFSLRYEPLAGDKPAGFGFSTWPLLGTKTLRVNLRPKENEILALFKKDCRYNLRRFKEADLQRCKVNDFDVFYKIWRKEASRKSLWIPGRKEYENLLKSFGENIFCITFENLAGAVVVMQEKTAFYYYSASLPAGKALQLPYLIIWEAMRQAKERGCVVWDFEGIYDSRWPNKGWLGFSHFKKSFGGQEIIFPGSFQKWLWPW